MCHFVHLFQMHVKTYIDTKKHIINNCYVKSLVLVPTNPIMISAQIIKTFFIFYIYQNGKTIQ